MKRLVVALLAVIAAALIAAAIAVPLTVRHFDREAEYRSCVDGRLSGVQGVSEDQYAQLTIDAANACHASVYGR